MLKAGFYYVGDLCYITEDAHCGVNVFEYENDNGDSVTCANFRTTYGDGTYNDQDGRRYDVDSGTIGCFPVSKYFDEGNVIEFKEDFEVSKKDGVIKFGHIEINTNV
jgi:hypothetical protein